MPQLPDLWYDPLHPPLEDVTPGPIRPVLPPTPPGATPDIIGYQRTYTNTASPDLPTLQVTATASLGSGEGPPDQPSGELAREARRQLDELQVYYDVRTISEPSPPPPADKEPGKGKVPGSTLEQEVLGATVVMSFELELLEDDPPPQTVSVAAVTIVERSLPNGAVDNYRAVRRTEARAQIQVTSGRARVRLFRNRVSVGYAVDVPGGGPSALVRNNAGRLSTYDMAVRSLAAGTVYTNCIMYWKRG